VLCVQSLYSCGVGKRNSEINIRVKKCQESYFQSYMRQNIIFSRMVIDFLNAMFCILNGILEKADKHIVVNI